MPTLAVEQEVLSACLSCGWVHGPPWRCPESAAKSVRVFRVGKANTLLMTPNDWSTLSNGTVDGEPTGLHRFVGENRFVFVLLNVTDGHGNLASYDLESKDWNGAYADLGGNGLPAYHVGATPEPARFGLGARLSGSGSFVTVDSPTQLDWVNTSMTVSFWIRPDEDYAGGAEWRWSVGRKDLWRLGYHNNATGPFHGLRFEVRDTAGGTPRYAQSAISLYAGRWYHVAATLLRGENVGGYTWSELRVYVDGEEVGFCSCATTTVRDGTAFLRIGWDESTGGRFKGIVDEFRLYKTSLSQDSVRGLPWFLHGANNVLVPRGVFFDSKLFANLNNSAQMTSGPLAGANVNANDNKGTASLNARVIQMVITKNATLAQASQILTLTRTNTTNVVAALPLLVASEFYTLGLAKEVRDLAANVVVENSGNFSAPPPSPTLWELFWNTVAGWANAVWNALEAVKQFFLNVVKWLVDVAVGIAIGYLTGNWTYFKQNVLEPLRKAIEAFFKFIKDLISAIIDGITSTVFKPILEAMVRAGSAVGRVLMELVDQRKSSGSFNAATLNTFRGLVFGDVFTVMVVVGIALIVVLLVLTPFLTIASFLMGFIQSLLVSAILAVLAGLAPGNSPLSLLSIFGGFDSEKGPSAPQLVGLLHGNGIPEVTAQIPNFELTKLLGDIFTVITEVFIAAACWIGVIGELMKKIPRSGMMFLIGSMFFLLWDLIGIVAFDALEKSVTAPGLEGKLQKTTVLAFASIAGIAGLFLSYLWLKDDDKMPASITILGIVSMVTGIFSVIFTIGKLWAFALEG